MAAVAGPGARGGRGESWRARWPELELARWLVKGN
jgi:hypothetical protein